MAATKPYDEDLRAIGQALEARNISVFELKRLADRYVIEGTPQETSSLRTKVRQWYLQLRSGSIAESLTFRLADVEKLSQAGRAKRSRPRHLPDFYSVSNTLRTVGAYLDAKGVELVELHKRPISITLSYRDKEGHQQGEDRTVSSFYNLFLELYGKRGQQKTLTVKHPNSQPSALTS
ncbi:MAG: hypothetical protein E6J74_07185 [Deltaproteobacteria bacterium]|nr:MAG: hypothetical protein E6J74_07185 [Deltaproteobacteria bacterium]